MTDTLSCTRRVRHVKDMSYSAPNKIEASKSGRTQRTIPKELDYLSPPENVGRLQRVDTSPNLDASAFQLLQDAMRSSR
jgi:hypothetical protein